MTNLTGLPTKLLNYANLTVLPSTGVTSDGANSVVALNNPFTSDLLISNIQSNVTSHGLFVGSIVQSVNFPAAGKSTSVSPVLTLNLNLYPPDIFSLVRVLVVQSGQDPAALDGVVVLGGINYSPSTVSESGSVSKRSIAYEDQQFMDEQVAPTKFGLIDSEISFDRMFSPDTESEEKGLVLPNSIEKRAAFDYSGLVNYSRYFSCLFLILVFLRSIDSIYLATLSKPSNL